MKAILLVSSSSSWHRRTSGKRRPVGRCGKATGRCGKNGGRTGEQWGKVEGRLVKTEEAKSRGKSEKTGG